MCDTPTKNSPSTAHIESLLLDIFQANRCYPLYHQLSRDTFSGRTRQTADLAIQQVDTGASQFERSRTIITNGQLWLVAQTFLHSPKANAAGTACSDAVRVFGRVVCVA